MIAARPTISTAITMTTNGALATGPDLRRGVVAPPRRFWVRCARRAYARSVAADRDRGEPAGAGTDFSARDSSRRGPGGGGGPPPLAGGGLTPPFSLPAPPGGPGPP